MFTLSEFGKHSCFVALGWSGRAPPLWWCCPPTCGPPGRSGARQNCESKNPHLLKLSNCPPAAFCNVKRSASASHLWWLWVEICLWLSYTMVQEKEKKEQEKEGVSNPPSLVWRWCGTSWRKEGGWRTPSAACTTSYGWESGTRYSENS